MTDKDSIAGSGTGVINQEHDVSFTVLDEATGTPLENINVLIKCSKGVEHQKKTDADGKAKFQPMPEGSCDVVRLFKKNIIMEEKEEYTLKDNDTLQLIAENEIAAGNDISWEKIAQFNWGKECREKRIANEYMRDMCGCTHYTSTGEMLYKKTNGANVKIKIPKNLVRSGLAIDTNHEIKIRIIENPEQFKACCGIPYITFEFSKSFIRPNAEPYLEKLKELVLAHSEAKAMIFGHADKVGSEEPNKKLSERRAKSAFSLLTKNPEYWVTLYKEGKSQDNENWGVKTIQVILNTLNQDANIDITNTLDERTRKEIRSHTSIGDKGDISDSALKDIFQAYMDYMMEGIDLDESRFVPLKHAGCGEFNPIIDIEKSEEDNRRVTFFLFDGERLPRFPCSNTDISPCRKYTEQYKTFRYYKQFKCSYYDSLAKNCESEVVIPDIIAFDSHMHFMSGHCTPIPLLWNQLPAKPRIRRSYLDKAGGWALRYSAGLLPIPKVAGLVKGSRLQRQSTLAIADEGIAQNNAIYNKEYSKDLKKSLGRKKLTPMIPMPMDMAYAHMDGYKGIPIYQRVPERKYFIWNVEVQGTLIPEIVYIWPDEVCKGRDDLLSESKAEAFLKQYNSGLGTTSGIQTEKYSSKGKEGFYYFWARNSQFEDEEIEFLQKHNIAEDHKKRTPVWLHSQEMDLFEDWFAQREATLAAAIKYPFQYMPMYHYEPRRWSKLENSSQPQPKNYNIYDEVGEWDEPFREIATLNQAGTFVGFKMYTALGYKPLDGKLKETMNEFYGKCQSEGIPVLCHCSPSGMYSHDRDLYFDSEFHSYKIDYAKEKRGIKFWSTYQKYDKEMGFYDKFGRPSAWEEQVLTEYPKLKLCLAHFGGGSSEWADWKDDTFKKIKKKEEKRAYIGQMVSKKEEEKFISDWYFYDKKKEGVPKPKRWIREMVEMMEVYEHFYTDISFHFVRDHKKQLSWLIKNNPHIKERIMFGTDWYMTELDNWSINKFVRRAKTALDEISEELEKETGIRDDLWLKFSRINPMKFYGVRGIADNFAEGLRAAVDALEDELTVEAEENRSKKTIEVILNDSELEKNLEIIKQSDLF